MDRQGVADAIKELVADAKAVKGDGFGRAGDLKSKYKKACKALQELLLELERPPEPEVFYQQLNPDCFGVNADNLPGCECKKVWLKVLGE